MREVVGVIAKSEITPSESDLLQMVKAVRSQAVNFRDDTGAQNEWIIACDPPFTAPAGGYPVGLPLRVRVLHTNDDRNVTLDAGAGPQPVVKMDGSQPGIGALVAGGIYTVVNDGARWQLSNYGLFGDDATNVGGGTGGTGPGGTPGAGGDVINNYFYVGMPYAVDTSLVANVVVAPFSPAVTSLAAGFVCVVKLANTFTGRSATLQCNALAAKPIYGNGPDGAILPSDAVAGDLMFCRFDGTAFWIDPYLMITQNVTFNINTTADYNTLMKQLRRKRIDRDALVTIALAAGEYTPFAIDHPDGDRILVKGVMNGLAVQAAELTDVGGMAAAVTANLALLRSRYKTEIKIQWARDKGLFTGPATGAKSRMDKVAAGIANMGGGMPVLKDLLITGDITAGSVGLSGPAIFGWLHTYDEREIGVLVRNNRSLYCDNVVTAVCGVGFQGSENGSLVLTDCIGMGNSSYGVLSHSQASVMSLGTVTKCNPYGVVAFSGYMRCEESDTRQSLHGDTGIAVAGTIEAFRTFGAFSAIENGNVIYDSASVAGGVSPISLDPSASGVGSNQYRPPQEPI